MLSNHLDDPLLDLSHQVIDRLARPWELPVPVFKGVVGSIPLVSCDLS